MIPITKPFLPPKQDYLGLVESAMDRNWLTNNGPILQEVESGIQNQLGSCKNLVVSNGTMALQIAIKALGFHGNILTTPFSYIATASSIAWEGCHPTFVDVQKNQFNVASESIAQHIDKDVGGILLTHCFGLPLEVEKLDALAGKHNIPIIYDASHAFGSTVDGESIMNFGDISTCSYHATKLFHMIEGGGVFTRHNELHQKCALLRNFGHDGPENFTGVGINGKNSEIHAAMGLANLKYVNNILAKRKEQCLFYDELLSSQVGIKLVDPNLPGWNYAYYPILLESEAIAMHTQKTLNNAGIFPRRYFYPSLHNVNGWGGECPNSQDVASRVLCLPLFHDLTVEDQVRVGSVIGSAE